MRSAAEVLVAMAGAFDTGCVEDVEAFVDGGYIDHQGLPGETIVGPAGFARVVEVARRGYHELRVTVEDLIESGDRAAARLHWSGTRATGETVERDTLEIIHVSDGRAVEHWGGRS